MVRWPSGSGQLCRLTARWVLAGRPGGFRAPGCSAGYPLGVKLIEFGCLPPLVASRRSWWVLAGGGMEVGQVLMHASGGMDFNARLGDFKAERHRCAWAGRLGKLAGQGPRRCR